jgi:hypothetical protein
VVTLAGSSPTAKSNQILLVHDFEDLVKAADEIEQPILHEVNEIQGKHNFYVVSRPYIYSYSLLYTPADQRHLDEAGTDSAPSL